MSGHIIKYNYKNTLDEEYWEEYLERNLEKSELFLLQKTENDNNINKKIVEIYNLATKHELYIPYLTNLHGNCLFESLQYHKICDDIDEFRCGLAFLLIIFKDKKYFIPDQELTLEELFNLRNDIKCVYCKKNKRVYKYTFITMCIDLACDNKWNRLDTQLILSSLSLLFNIKISIFHNNGHITTIETINNEHTKTIYIGLIDEYHYFPLDIKTDKQFEKCPKYVDNLKEFHNWAKGNALQTGRIIYDYDLINIQK